MDTVQKLFRFLDESPTCYHAAANAKAALTAAGAVELRESEQWKLEKGTLYVVERGDSAIPPPSRCGRPQKRLPPAIPCGSVWSLTAAVCGVAGWTGPCLWRAGW